MIEHEWHFRLDGEELDVRDLVNLFGNRITSIKHGDGKSHLVLKLPYSSSQYNAGSRPVSSLLRSSTRLLKSATATMKM